MKKDAPKKKQKKIENDDKDENDDEYGTEVVIANNDNKQDGPNENSKPKKIEDYLKMNNNQDD